MNQPVPAPGVLCEKIATSVVSTLAPPGPSPNSHGLLVSPLKKTSSLPSVLAITNESSVPSPSESKGETRTESFIVPVGSSSFS